MIVITQLITNRLIVGQFHDGVYLVLIMGLLEGFFVPLYDFYLTPGSFENKVAFVLVELIGIYKYYDMVSLSCK